MFSLVGAVKPTQVINNGCEIKFPQITTLKQNDMVKLHTHVINTTTGANNRLTNDTTYCYIHLYNTSGHTLERNLSWDSNNLEWDLMIKSNNFSIFVEFAFYEECVSSDSICSVSGSYIVNPTGIELTIERAIIHMGLLAILVLLLMVTVGTIPFLPTSNDKTEEGELMAINNLKYVRSFLWVLSYFWIMIICYVSSNLAFAYLGTLLFAKLLFAVFYLMAILMLPFVVIWFMYIIAEIFKDKELKRLMEHGVEGSA